MHPPTSDLRIRSTKPLLAPAILEEEIPQGDASAELVARSRRAIAEAMLGGDDRLVVIAQGRLSPSIATRDATIERIGAWMSGLWQDGADETKNIDNTRNTKEGSDAQA
jgi:hypothetical protein